MLSCTSVWLLFYWSKKGEKDRKIPFLWPPLLLMTASCLFELFPSVEEKSRIRGNIKKEKNIFLFKKTLKSIKKVAVLREKYRWHQINSELNTLCCGEVSLTNKEHNSSLARPKQQFVMVPSAETNLPHWCDPHSH